MGLYKRNNIYHVNKSICGIHFRFSLKTSDRYLAKELYDLWLKERLKEIVLQKSKCIQTTLSALHISDTRLRPSLNSAFNEFLRSLDKKAMSPTHRRYREKIKIILKEQNFEWENINSREIDEIQRKIQSDYAPHTAYKLIGGLIRFLRFAVKRGYYTQNEYGCLRFYERTSYYKTPCYFQRLGY